MMTKFSGPSVKKGKIEDFLQSLCVSGDDTVHSAIPRLIPLTGAHQYVMVLLSKLQFYNVD